MLAKVECTWCNYNCRMPAHKITVVTQNGKATKLFKADCPRCKSSLQWRCNPVPQENVHILITFGAQLKPVNLTAADLAAFQKGLRENDCLVEVIENERNTAIHNREKT